MSAPPLLTIRLTDDDHVLRLLAELAHWGDPDAMTRARAFFAPEQPADGDLARVFAPLREICLPHVHPVDAVGISPQILVSRRGAVSAAMLAESPGLRLVQRLGARRKGLDIDACHAAGVAVSLLPRRSLAQVADHVMLLILALCRQLPAMQAGLSAGRGPWGQVGAVSYNWPGISGIRCLSGLTLGIVGMGEIGQLVADRARGFGMRVIHTVRPGQPPHDGGEAHDLPDLLAASDIVSLHVPPAGLTGPLIGRAELALMKPGAILINTARGALVDPDALAAALSAGHLAGAGLDVHAAEPADPASPLLQHPGVLATPHVAGGSRQEVLHEMRAICDNLVDAVLGRPPRHAGVSP